MTLAMAAPAQSERIDEPQSSMLGCLVIAARHRGVQLSVRQLARDYLLGPGEISVAQLLEVARGMRAAGERHPARLARAPDPRPRLPPSCC